MPFNPDPNCEEDEHDPTNAACICFRPKNVLRNL